MTKAVVDTLPTLLATADFAALTLSAATLIAAAPGTLSSGRRGAPL